MLESQCCSVGFQESGIGGVGDGMCGGGGAGAVVPRTAMAVCTVESHKGWSGGRGVYEVRE